MTGHVLSNDARWQDVLFNKCCYNYASFISSKEDKFAKEIKGRKTAVEYAMKIGLYPY
jgi:hypothetical protein